MSSVAPSPPDLAAARQRIQAAYSPDLLQSAGEQVLQLLSGHLRACQSGEGNVLNWNRPEANIDEADRLLKERATTPPESFVDRVREIVAEKLQRGHNLHHPRYIGHQVPASVPLAGLFDAIGAITNQVMAVYEMGPWATAIESALISAVGERVGFPPGSFAGLVTHGGSLANLTAQITARNVALPRAWKAGLAAETTSPVMLVQSSAHYSVTRTAGILGLGADQVVKIPLDDRGRMRVDSLRELLQQLRDSGTPVISVSACACATPTGAFDLLDPIADVCEDFGVWLHVDAAHGGAACFSETYRHLVAGLHRADSVVLDAHKMMFVPALCAFVFYKNREHRFETFQQDAPYLFDPSSPGIAEYDSGLKTIECTKRTAVYGLWGAWNTFGPELFRDLVDVTFSMGRTFHDKLVAAPDFEPLHEPECNIVAFRYLPEQLRQATPERIGEFQRTVRRKLIESGRFYIVQTSHNGVGALRVTIINPLTTPAHLDELLQAIREVGEST